jgi:hypothetical protein
MSFGVEMRMMGLFKKKLQTQAAGIAIPVPASPDGDSYEPKALGTRLAYQ